MTLNFVVIPTMIKPFFTKESSDYNLPTTSQFTPRNIRVAIYNEPNVTQPAYSLSSLLTNNYTALKTLLSGAGYQIDELTCNEIFDHSLMTADYDVFIMVDNLPRENITNYVKEFWLGGGGILGFDSALSYLLYAGIIIPESEGDENFGFYWAYESVTSHNISIRHPITKNYQVNDKFDSAGVSICYLDWSVLLGTSAGADTVKLANRDGDDNRATAVARDPINRGGRVVQLPGRGDYIEINMSDMIIDAIDWLCPRPKGRIVFDLSHQPRLGVDMWDEYTMFPGHYFDWRDELVSRHYTFDKLFPSPLGNFTEDRLNKYDMLVIVAPDYDISTSDRSVVTQWVQNGGSLLIFGEYPLGADFDLCDARINFLLNNFDLEMNLTYGQMIGVSATYTSIHPTTEACIFLSVDLRGAINITGNAYPIWKTSSDIFIAGQEYGKGRVILSSDMNWLTNAQIGNQDNRQYGINLANWLTACNADILLYIDDFLSPNYYITSVAIALNGLEIPFYLTIDDVYFNLSLTLFEWKLVIIDNPIMFFDLTVLDEIVNYLDAGGRLIMSSWWIDTYPGHPLWAELGFAFAGEMPDSSPIYIWDDTNKIFTEPVAYGDNYFNPTFDYGDEGDLLTVYDNATALAGLTLTPTADNAIIVLRKDGKTLYNGYLIDQFWGDLDDSTYEDRLELWTNEIAYMMSLIRKEEAAAIDWFIFLLIGIIAAAILAVVIIIVKVKKRKK